MIKGIVPAGSVLALVLSISGLQAQTARTDVCVLGDQHYSQGMVIVLGNTDFTCNPEGDWQIGTIGQPSGAGGCIFENKIYSKGAPLDVDTPEGSYYVCGGRGWHLQTP